MPSLFLSAHTPLLARTCRLFCLLLMCFAIAWLGACSGCDDDTTPAADMAQRIDQAQDMGTDQAQDLEQPDLAQPDLGQPDMPDMSRPPRRDMAISNFDFGQPDMPSEPFAIEEVIPPSGPVDGGTLIRIKGTSLQNGAQVFFSGQLVEMEPVDDVLVGRTPPASQPGPVSIKAIGPDGETSVIEDGFTYVTSLGVTSVSPSLIPVEGGVELELRGTGFDAQTMVNLGGEDALRVDVVSPELLRVIAPPHPRGVVDVRVTSTLSSVVLEDAVTYFERLELIRIEAASGPVAGGNQVTLFGKGFETDMQVQFAGRSAEVVQVRSRRGEADVVVPASASEGGVDVQLISSVDVSLSQNAYLYVNADSAARLGRVMPSLGALAGGNEVLLTGHKLDSASAFMFGTQPAQVLEAQPSFARLTVPAGAAAQSVDVVLEVSGAERDRLAAAYTYVANIELTGLTPNSGPVTGGTELTLTGEGLDGAERVDIGGLRAQIVSRAARELKIIAPAHSAGLVDVKVESTGGLERTLSDAYTYTQPLQVWGLSPSRGALSGGTYVEVRGQGFSGQLGVRFGDVPATIVRRVDQNNLYVYSPPNFPGEVELTVSADQDEAVAPYPYLYFNPASRFGGASGSEVDGSVNVSVLTTGGSPIPSAFVMLSTRPDTRYQGQTDLAGMVTLSGPDVLGAQSVTATAAGYSVATVQSIDAENITVFLNQSSPSPAGGGGGAGDPPPFGTIRGVLTNAGKLADPSDESSFDMAIVGTTSVGAFGGNPNPGDGSVVLGSGPYEITSRIGDLAVVALCGVFNENTQLFDPQFLAVARYLVISDQGEYEVDLECNVPLDQTLDIKLINPSYAPTGPNSNRATVIWNFGFEGFFRPPVSANSLESILSLPRQPALEGDLADVTLDLTAGSYTNSFAPYSQTALSDVTELGALLTMPPLLDVPEPVSPLPQGVIENSRITWQSSGPYFPSMHIIILRNEMGIPVWTMTAPGNENTVVLPDFPDFSALPITDRPSPIPQGPLFLSITAVRIPGFQYENFTYQDLVGSRWEASAVNRWSVSFP